MNVCMNILYVVMQYVILYVCVAQDKFPLGDKKSLCCQLSYTERAHFALTI